MRPRPCRGCSRTVPGVLLLILPCCHCRSSSAGLPDGSSNHLEISGFSTPPDDSLKTIAALARPVLRRELASGRSVLNGRKLTALRTRSTARNPVWWRVMPLHVCRRFQRLHFQPFTNFSAFLPEITPVCGLFSAIFSARFRSNSNTEWPTNAR